MRPAARFPAVLLAAALCAGLAACPGGTKTEGQTCGGTDDCAGELQCQAAVCVPRCLSAPECGDGFQCTGQGLCVAATGQTGDACTSETDCAAGLACQLDNAPLDGVLHATCGAATGARPAEAACELDADCRNGTCALGRCVDLCTDRSAPNSGFSSDCVDGDKCTSVPRVGSGSGVAFMGCLPENATIQWTIPASGPQSTIEVPVPGGVRSVLLSLEIDDLNQQVGVAAAFDPTAHLLFRLGANNSTNELRHVPAFGQSILQIPVTPDTAAGVDARLGRPLLPGDYHVTVESLRAPFSQALPIIGSATPRVTAVAKLGLGTVLDLHFYFLDFTEHPCADQLGAETLSAKTAATGGFFQTDYLGELRRVFNLAGISLGQFTYEDLAGPTAHPDLDGPDVSNASALLALGAHAGGINVFFVRALSPVGLQTFGPTPGPAGLAGTSQSGIIVGADTLCYRSWTDLARLTAHELAHYMGLYDNVALASPATAADPIQDNDSDANPSANLMFYSEYNGRELTHGFVLSQGQQDIIKRSPVLR